MTTLRIEQIAVLEFFVCARQGDLAEKEAAHELARMRAEKLEAADPTEVDPDDAPRFRKIQSEFPAPGSAWSDLLQVCLSTMPPY